MRTHSGRSQSSQQFGGVFFINPTISACKSMASHYFRKDKLFTMVKAYGSEFKRTLVYDRIKEDLRIFCANNTIDDVYNVKFLDIVEQVKTNVKTSISRLGEVGGTNNDLF